MCAMSICILPDRRGLLPLDGDDIYGRGQSLELDAARVGRSVLGALHRFLAGHDLRAIGDRGDACRLVYALAAEVLTYLRCVGEVDSDPDLGCKAVVAPMRREGALDGDRARERVVGRVEADEE